MARVERIRFFKGKALTRTKFHISLGHSTIMGTVTFFGGPAGAGFPAAFDHSLEYAWQEELTSAVAGAGEGGNVKTTANNVEVEQQYALLEFDAPVTCRADSLVIGSRLDADIHLNSCRLAFHGRLCAVTGDADYKQNFLPNLKIFKIKTRTGVVDRLHTENTLIGRGLFKKESQMDKFAGLKITLSTGEHGIIEGGFGQSGKYRLGFRSGLNPTTIALLASKKAGGKKKEAAASEDDPIAPDSIGVLLRFKKYIFDPAHRLIQT